MVEGRYGENPGRDGTCCQAGYWAPLQVQPQKGKRSKEPFLPRFKRPDWSKFQEFLDGEVRYTSLKKMFPEEADILFKAARRNAKWRWMNYKRLSEMVFTK